MTELPEASRPLEAHRNISECFSEAAYRIGVGFGQYRVRLLINRDKSVDGHMTIAQIPRHVGPMQTVRALSQTLLLVPGSWISLEWRLAPPRDMSEMKEMDERYLRSQSKKEPYYVPTSYVQSDGWGSAFATAERVLRALRERGRVVSGFVVHIHWSPTDKPPETLRRKPLKEARYKRTSTWRRRIPKRR